MEWIELEKFIKNAIIGIDKALKSAWNITEENYLFSNWTTNDWKWNIHFDLTVYSEKSNEANSEWKIKVFWLWNAWFSALFKNKQNTTSNIKFSIVRSK